MICNSKMVHTMGFTPDELLAMSDTVKILEMVEKLFPEDVDMVNMTTGEVINTNELRRVCGILTGIRDRANPSWFVEITN